MPPEELSAARKYFPRVVDNMVGCTNDLVICRYSALPFYHEVSKGLALQGSRMVNTHAEHQYIANFDYYHDIPGLTPKTWFRLQDVPKGGGPFVVKGITNSKKHEWNTKMYAPTYDDAVRIALDLGTDMYLADQPAIVREYVPLQRLETGLNGLPFSNEWRCFFYGTTLLSTGFYWTESETKGLLDVAGCTVALEAAQRLAEHTTFFTVDVARTEAGSWVVIEVNDGQMAGLSDNDPDTFYKALAKATETPTQR